MRNVPNSSVEYSKGKKRIVTEKKKRIVTVRKGKKRIVTERTGKKRIVTERKKRIVTERKGKNLYGNVQRDKNETSKIQEFSCKFFPRLST